ncbi:MAG TPA: type II secretion system F family protein [Gemmatimonadaceae bacterium]|nr:type II secretion system F family protein [Gemmatimonadaceae bacterium]
MILALTAIFFATMAFVVGGYVLVNRRTLEAAELARSRLRTMDGAEKTFSILKDDRISDVPFLNRLFSGRRWVDAVSIQLTRAGSELRPVTFMMIMVTSGILGMLFAGMLTPGLMSLFLSVGGWVAPMFWLRRRQKKRLSQFEQQLPDAIDMLVSAMKAGYSFQAATQFLGDELVAPLGPEFARFYDEQRLGVDVRSALIGMQSRVDSIDLKMFVTAVLIQRETGGNLGDVLSGLADLIRQRLTMKGQIQTLIAEPKLSARFLAVLPLIVFTVLSAMNPHFFDPMTAEGSPGRTVLIGSAISVVIGYMIMMRIADVDI